MIPGALVSMKRGNIPISNDFELEYRYYDKDQKFKYFNRKFEIFLLEKKHLKKNYILHIDNANTSPGDFTPHVYTASNINKQLNLGVTTLNWNDIKNNFLEFVVKEIGENNRDTTKKALGKLHSPKL